MQSILYFTQNEQGHNCYDPEQIICNLRHALKLSEEQRLVLTEENRRHRRKLSWTRELLANRELSPSDKIVLMGMEPELAASGLRHVNLTHLSKCIGLSPKTTGRGVKRLAEAGGIERQEERVLGEDGSFVTHILLAPTERTARPRLIIPPKPRNQGGKRTRCKHCGSENVVQQVTIICQDCGTELHRKCKPLKPSAHRQTDEMPESCPAVIQQDMPIDEHQDDSIGTPSDSPMGEPVIEPEVPRDNLPTGGDCQETMTAPPRDNLSLVLKPEEPRDKLSLGDPKPATAPPAALTSVDHDALVALLMDIAGDASQHIVMNDGSDATFEGKYRTVHRPLRVPDIRAHLAGHRTIGATLSHTDGTTRALCFDTDTPEGLTLLHEAAALLKAAGYHPLIEVSPAGRGGHLWVIFSNSVPADAAYHYLCGIAPQLRDLKEHWPTNNRKVRLLAGCYVTPASKAWCPLIGPHGQEMTAKSLLTFQTPALLVSSVTHSISSHERNNETNEMNEMKWHEPPTTSKAQVSEGPDAYWQRKYGESPLWFAWTPQQLAAWYNARVGVAELLPPERGGKALAPWDGGEDTPSVAFTPDGKGWVDFRARSIRADGTPDGGDALELAVRLSGVQPR